MTKPKKGDNNTKNIDPAGIDVARDTMLVDLTRVVVEEMRAAPKVWQMMSEEDQQSALDRLDARLRDVVATCVRIIATGDKPSIPATVESVTFKDGIKCALKISRGAERRHDLAESAGCQVLIVLPGAEDMMGGDKPKPDPQQPELMPDGQPTGSAKKKRADAPKDAKAEGATVEGEFRDVTAAPAAPATPSLPVPGSILRAFAVRPKTATSRRMAAAGIWAVDSDEAWNLYLMQYPGYHARADFYIEEVKPDLFEQIGCLNPTRPEKEAKAARGEKDEPEATQGEADGK